MFRPMPSPKGSNHEGLYVPAKFVRSPVVAAYDSVTGLAPRKLLAPASAPKKPRVDGPSRQENLQALLDFLSANLPADLYGQVEEHLMSSVYGSQERDTAYAPAADRRPKIAGDAAGASDFASRFPSSRRIGFA
ncbi:hypothetical protein [Methylocystis rosea]|uniref:Uncharacterized protein n=1 Tax=Methylocystis rosea TaxID=173366 RepID=A0A3G8M5H0_9HYPH|nr:hypothetical protein [Methylocystis rosea]AZG76330.1 hypothetical protein EHO51_06080 [Methylocystis rosea]